MKLKFVQKMISGMLIAACTITSLTGVQISTAHAADKTESNLVIGEIYHFVDQDWMVTEIHDHHAVLQALGGFEGVWAGSAVYPTLNDDGSVKNYHGTICCREDIYDKDFGDYYYGKERMEREFSKYEYKDAANDGGCGQGLYISKKLGTTGYKEKNGEIKYWKPNLQDPWYKALEIIRERSNSKKVWLGQHATKWTMTYKFTDENDGITHWQTSPNCCAFVYMKDEKENPIITGADARQHVDQEIVDMFAPFAAHTVTFGDDAMNAFAFNLDTSKVVVTKDHRIVSIDAPEEKEATPSKGQTDVCIISDISDEELDPDQLQVSVPQKLLFATKGNTNELIGTYSADNKLKNDGVNKVQFTSAKLNTEDGWEFVSDATKESEDNKVDFTITAERGDKAMAATTMTAAEMVNKKDLSTDENYKLNSKNKTDGSNYTELTSSGHVSGFSGDVSTETKIGDIAWKVKVTH